MAIRIIVGNDGIQKNDNDLEQITNNPTSQNNDDLKVSGKKNPAKSLVINLISSQVKNFASAGIQAYTKYTGQGNLQYKINMAAQATTNFLTVFAATATGGVGGGIVSGAAIIGQYGLQEFQNHIEILTNNRNLSVFNRGLGTRNINGGRYGA